MDATQLGCTHIEALKEELADASSAREVLALALARLLRDTKSHQLHPHPGDPTDSVAVLETQLNLSLIHI